MILFFRHSFLGLSRICSHWYCNGHIQEGRVKSRLRIKVFHFKQLHQYPLQPSDIDLFDSLAFEKGDIENDVCVVNSIAITNNSRAQLYGA
ncbi:hypothetical protein DPMN_073147 [Dreissena polymorpha]|uniref:Uncharacterized protein n=1 Tax=Dreissena polymorpha TaxID=45954 RepID=A0A9D4BYI1_DREPO|nr:hypothetical protein DPMN_073147 [Dreissena polymorpha]